MILLAKAEFFVKLHHMLTPRQIKYLENIPKELADKPVQILSWKEQGLTTASVIIAEANIAAPDTTFHLVGSVPLRIAGLRDIDIVCAITQSSFTEYREKLSKIFGKPNKQNASSIVWHFERDGYEVSLYITDPELSDQLERQVREYELLKKNPKLLRTYERLKLALNGQPYRLYQEKKREFFNTLPLVEL